MDDRLIGEDEEYSKMALKEEEIKNERERRDARFDPDAPLSACTKWSFGIGTIGNGATHVIGFFWNPFLLEVALVTPTNAGTLQLIVKVWDAIIDPIVGYLSDKTRSRWGRRRPWLLFSAFPTAISFLCLWLALDLENQAQKFAYFFVMYCLQRSFYTCYFVPFTALTMELSSSEQQRNILTQYRFILGGIGQIGFILIMGQLSKVLPDVVGQSNAYLVGAYILAVLIVCSCLICFFGVREKDYEIMIVQEVDQLGILKGLLFLLQNKPYMILCGVACCGWLSLQIIQANLLLYFGYVLGLRDDFTYGLIVGLLMIIPTVPIIRRISVRIGKKLTWVIGCVILYGFCFAAAFAPFQNVAFMYFFCILYGVGIGCLFYLPWAMLPDAIDLDELKIGLRREGLYYSFFVFFEKVAAGLGLALSNYILAAGGYNAQNPLQNRAEVTKTLKMIVSIGPAVLLTISLILLFFYPIGKRKLVEIQDSLAAKRKAALEESGAIVGQNKN